MKPYRLSLIAIAVVLSLLASTGWTTEPTAAITGEEAARHIGETQTVRGSVADTAFLAKNKDQPTFLNLDRPFPNYSLTVVIPGEHRSKFTSAPESFFNGKTICVTGKIAPRGEKIQIVVTDPAQIKVVAESVATPPSALQAAR